VNRFSQHWQRRWFVLKGNTLSRYKNQNVYTFSSFSPLSPYVRNINSLIQSSIPKETIELKGALAKPHKRKYCIAIIIKSSSKRKNEGCEVQFFFFPHHFFFCCSLPTMAFRCCSQLNRKKSMICGSRNCKQTPLTSTLLMIC
jgi:hypothetical protein